MNIEVIKLSEYKEYEWSGGKTTEFYIHPKGVNFRDRTFNYRLSSARFTGTESKFSDFSGYQRYILPLKGCLSIQKQSESKIWLKPYESFAFSGRDEIDSENTAACEDFNFIVREDLPSDFRVFSRSEHIEVEKGGTLLLYGGDMGLEIYAEGNFLCGLNLSEKRLILIEAEETRMEISLKCLSTPVIACGLRLSGERSL